LLISEQNEFIKDSRKSRDTVPLNHQQLKIIAKRLHSNTIIAVTKVKQPLSFKS
jgi:hypothetical protein